MTKRPTLTLPRVVHGCLLLVAFAFLQTTTCAQNWNQLGADIDGEAADNFSGDCVSLSADGSTLAIGAPGNNENGIQSGHVRVYKLITGSWTQQGADIDGEVEYDGSGWSVSLSADGSTLAIGARGNDDNGTSAGHVRVYQWNSTSWTQLGVDIDGEAAGDESGCSISLNANGGILAIGSRGNGTNGLGAGHVRVYQWIDTAWTQLGADIDGEAANDESGWSVSISDDGSTLAIGARGNDDNGTSAGHVRVHHWSGNAWTQQGADIDGEAYADESGHSVSLSADGAKLAIGAPRNNGNGPASGHVRVYQWSGIAWLQQGADIDGEGSVGLSGYSVSLSADGLTLAIGAIHNHDNGTAAGHVRVYKLISGDWIQYGVDIDGEAEYDESGSSVDLSADGLTLAIGAIHNDGNGLWSGHVRVYQDPTVGIVNNDFGPNLTVHPNPTSGRISINLRQHQSSLQLAVSDITGKHVATHNFGSTSQATFELEGPSGMYFLDITSTEGKSARLKVVKN